MKWGPVVPWRRTGRRAGHDEANCCFCIILSDSPESKFYVPTFQNILVHTTYEVGTECSETSGHKIQTPWNHPKERIQHSEHGTSLKTRLTVALSNTAKAPKNKSKFPCLGVPFGPVTRIQSPRPRSL